MPVVTTMDSVFDGLVGPALLVTGREVTISDAVPADLDEVRRFYGELGDTSSYYRFFGIRRSIPDAELRAVVSHDVPHHVTLLAWLDDRLIGIGELVGQRDPADAEVAFAVADDHHHEGVATLLIERLAVLARRCGFRRLTARTMSGNRDMLLVFRTCGLPTHATSDGGEVSVTLDLDSLDGLEHEAAHRRRTAADAAASLNG